METLVLEFKKSKQINKQTNKQKIGSDDEAKHCTFYPSSKAERIISEGDTDDLFESAKSNITSNIQKSLEKGSGYIIDLVIDQNINISKYKSLSGNNYIKLPKGLDHPKKKLLLIFKILITMNALNDVSEIFISYRKN